MELFSLMNFDSSLWDLRKQEIAWNSRISLGNCCTRFIFKVLKFTKIKQNQNPIFKHKNIFDILVPVQNLLLRNKKRSLNNKTKIQLSYKCEN